jgi:hypothetical protein
LGSVRWLGQIDSYQKFVLGTIDVLMNPLPESQLQFNGTLRSKNVIMDWTMRGNDLQSAYWVQYSTDGVRFQDLGQLPATTSLTATYQFIHNQPAAGWNFYRIVAVNLEGQRFVSKTIRIWNGAAVATPTVYPNPITGNQVNLYTNGLTKGVYNLQLTGMDGKILEHRSIYIPGNAQMLSLDFKQPIPSGIYWLTLTGHQMEPVRIKIMK